MNIRSSSAGILLPIFSLPNPYGIGTLGQEAYDFVDFLIKSKQSYWQVLPLGPTSYGDSPYQSFSTFAGNPYFIDFDLLKKDGLLETLDYEYLRDESNYINYSHLYETRFIVLRAAYQNFKELKDQTKFNDFIKDNEYWLKDYSLFMALKYQNNGKSFNHWAKEYLNKDKVAIEKYYIENNDEVRFWSFIQYVFYKQWLNLKEYANNKGLKIIGDMPIYTAYDSSDVWSKPTYFQLDEKLVPKKVAGCPPDGFTPLGQLWGNPLYNWQEMKKDNYRWWIERFKNASKLFDVIRIDHFRGFEAYYTIPYGDKDATRGKWEKGPNVKLFKAIEKELPNLDIIAENLGFLTPEVDKMLKKLNYPGMKVLEFSFNPNDIEGSVSNFEVNNVVYPGTHDNPPIRQWFDELDKKDRNYVKDYLFFKDDYDCGNALIRCALASHCRLAIISFVDYLQKNKEGRLNTPSTLGNNWIFRIEKNDLNNDLASYIAYLTTLYHRN